MNADRLRTIGATVALVALLALLIGWLRATAPAPTSDVTVDVPAGDPLTCEELTDPDTAPSASGTGGDVAGLATSGPVLACPDAFDGLQVTYIGEVVGDVLARDGGSWLLVNDDPYALEQGPLTPGGEPAGTNSGLTVWLPDPIDELADEPGREDRRGDVLLVTGEVLRTDPADGGGLTIRASDAEVLAEAQQVEVPVHWPQVVAAIVLAVLALGTLWRERQQSDR